jgi:peptidoglycan/xylan/chitin deacetylase (PgdA/CDA1 family)
MTMRRSIIRTGLWACRLGGLFAVARRVTRRRLRVLCYHGFALDDEAAFRPSLFISADTFARRMRYIARKAFPVISLDDAVRLLEQDAVDHAPVVITIDDGFHSTHAIAAPELKAQGFPSTLYLTSYYFEKGGPILQLALAYICWKSPLAEVNLAGLGLDAAGDWGQHTLDGQTRADLANRLFVAACTAFDSDGRTVFARRLAARMEVDYDAIVSSRKLSLVSRDELRDLAASGMAIELHTHRHVLPEDMNAALSEIAENRAVIETVTGRPAQHFCYPSGVWSASRFPALRMSGVATATTCEAGLARHGANLLALPRVLDDSRVSQIEFEAELSGISDLYRDLVGAGKRKAATLSAYGNWVAETALPVLAA